MNPWEVVWTLVSWFLAIGCVGAILGGIPYLLFRVIAQERAAWKAYLTRLETWTVVQGTAIAQEQQKVCSKCGKPWVGQMYITSDICATCLNPNSYATKVPRYTRPDPPRLILYHPRQRYAAEQRLCQQELIAAYERALAVSPQTGGQER